MSSQRTVIIASKDPALLSAAAEIGRSTNATMVPVTSLAAAVDALHAGSVRVTVIDQALADGTGLDLLLRLRQIDPEAKVVFLAEAPTEELERQVRAAGVSYFGNKPVNPGLFRRVIEKLLEHETRRITVQGTAR